MVVTDIRVSRQLQDFYSEAFLCEVKNLSGFFKRNLTPSIKKRITALKNSFKMIYPRPHFFDTRVPEITACFHSRKIGREENTQVRQLNYFFGG